MRKILNWLSRVVFASMVIVIISARCGLAEGEARTADLNVLIQKSGIYEQVGQFANLVQMGLTQYQLDQNSFSEEELREFIQLTNESFEAGTMRDDIYKFLEKKLNHDEIVEVLKWLESPLGERITKMEEEGSTIEAQTEIRNSYEDLLSEPDRVALVQKLDSVAKVVESSVKMFESSELAVNSAMMSKVPIKERLTAQQMMLMSQQNNSHLRESLEPQILAAMVYVYRNLSEDDVMEYIKFYESEAGLKYNHAVTEAFNFAVVNGSKRLGKVIGDNLLAEKYAE